MRATKFNKVGTSNRKGSDDTFIVTPNCKDRQSMARIVHAEEMHTGVRASRYIGHPIDPFDYFANVNELRLMILSFLSISTWSNCALVSKAWLDVSEQALLAYLRNNRDILEKEEVRAALGREVRHCSVLQNQLLRLVRASASSQDLGLAPSIAISLLNAAKLNLSKMVNLLGIDLKGVCIAGAVLDGAVLDGINLEGADLQKVRLHRAWWRNADLRGCKLAEIDFGVLPEKMCFHKTQCCCYSSDGRYQATGDDDKRVRVWDLQSGKCIYTFRHKYVHSLAFSSDGKFLASGGNGGVVRVWDLQKGELLCSLAEHKDWISSVAFSFCGRFLASGSGDNTVRVWKLKKQKCLRVFSEHTDRVMNVQFSPDGRFLASASDDNTVRIWNIQDDHCIHILRVRTNKALAFSPNGMFLATGGYGLRVWNVRSGQCVFVEDLPKDKGKNVKRVIICNSVAFSPDGKFLASGGEKALWLSDDRMAEQQKSVPAVRVWNLKTRKCLHVPIGLVDHLWQVQFRKQDGQLMYYANGTWRWRIGGDSVQLESTTNSVLNGKGAMIVGATGLSESNRSFVRQLGVIDDQEMIRRQAKEIERLRKEVERLAQINSRQAQTIEDLNSRIKARSHMF